LGQECQSRRTPGPELDLDEIFDYNAYLTHLPEVFQRLEEIR